MTLVKRYNEGRLVEYTINGAAVKPGTNPQITPKHWPVMLLPLKLLAQPNDRGAGDIIERTIGPLGGNAFKLWYKTTFGRECGCNTRKEHWNNRYPL